MKNLLIIYPHWPPSNLAGVHRPRLVANYILEFGWKPFILTVDPEFYEEAPDWDLVRTVNDFVEVHQVSARPVSKSLRLIGDIGLRAWPMLKKKALELISERQIDFIWIPIPSFYMALLGRVLHNTTGVPYGIDYIDPWIRDISNRRSFRADASLLLAKFLEPYAVSKVSLLTGVSEGYYQPVIERNFKNKPVHHLSFPYGFDPNDHLIQLPDCNTPWSQEDVHIKPILYAGAFLPKARFFIEALFKAVAELRNENRWPYHQRFYFVGTGFYPGKSIADYAQESGLSDIVKEDRERHPFLHILNWLNNAAVVMVIGSTEKHYTASKTFQAILSNRPLLAILHKESTALAILQQSAATKFSVPYEESMNVENLTLAIKDKLLQVISASDWAPDIAALDQYSARSNAALFASKLDLILDEKISDS